MLAGTRGATRALGYPDNVNPRAVLDTMEKEGKIKPATMAKLRRREAAHLNCLEGLPTIVGAVVAGNAAGLGAKYMNTMVLSYLGLRTVFGKEGETLLMQCTCTPTTPTRPGPSSVPSSGGRATFVSLSPSGRLGTGSTLPTNRVPLWMPLWMEQCKMP